MRWGIILIVILLKAATVFGLELEEAVSQALQKNPEILAAKSVWLAKSKGVAAQATWPDPQFEIMYEQIPQGGNISDAQMKMYGVSQQIPFPGKLSLKRKYGEDVARAGFERYQAKIREIVDQVKEAYYSLYYIEQAIQTNQENAELLNKFKRIAEAKYVVGKASQHDVIRAKIELSLLQNDLLDLKQRRATAASALNTLLNEDLQRPVEMPSELKIADNNNSLAELTQEAEKLRPEIKAVIKQLAASEKKASLAQMQFLPDFKVTLLQREVRNGGLDGWNARFMLNLPVWFWSKTSALEAANEERAATRQSYTGIKNKVLFEVKEAYLKVDEAERMVILFEETIVPQAKQALRAATIAYQADEVDFLTLISSQKTLEDSKLGYFKARTNLGKALARLERAVGIDLGKLSKIPLKQGGKENG
jgi:cobalt-zinc-cadmium efflux system outer membrane protein